MANSRSSHTRGIEFGVGALAAALAVAECVVAIDLVNRAAIATAIGLPEWGAVLVTSGAIAIIVVVVLSVMVGAIPAGALSWEHGTGLATFEPSRGQSH